MNSRRVDEDIHMNSRILENGLINLIPLLLIHKIFSLRVQRKSPSEHLLPVRL